MKYLLEATGEKTKSKALDRAAEFYLQMRGDTAAVPNGAFVELMEKAEKQGSVTAEEIAEVLHTEELPVEVQTSWSIGISD
ncbi:hypothetical protein V5735_03540 (plasmid) [Haladaptatus sp. SPP-AMP-3]|uniref:hypothetical protein n=1 Tax=Haladaptatus sp. SPP-AMP-3 TaxID=3121295 RepID=UPI003C301D0D